MILGSFNAADECQSSEMTQTFTVKTLFVM